MFSNLNRHEVLNKISFKIHDVDVGIVNAIRRVILADVPAVAVAFDAYNKDLNDTHFIKNTSSLHNEMLGHRISMIPLHIDIDTEDDYDPNTFKFVINKHNTSAEMQYVTTHDIKIFDKDGNDITSSHHKKIFPDDPVTKDPIIITKLKPNLFNSESGEALHVDFKARKGTGASNASWCPVSMCSYSFVVDKERAAQALKEKLDGVTEQDRITHMKRSFETLDKYRFFKINKYQEPCEFDFVIENEVSTAPEVYFKRAIKLLKKKLNGVVNSLSGDVENGDEVSLNVINDATNFYMMNIYNEEHTLGNLLQSFLYNNYIRGNKSELTYVGYNVPHPLEKVLTLKMKFNSPVNLKAFLTTKLQDCIKYLDAVEKEWDAFVTHGHSNKPVVLSDNVKEVKPKKTSTRSKSVAKDADAVDAVEKPKSKSKTIKTAK